MIHMLPCNIQFIFNYFIFICQLLLATLNSVLGMSEGD